MKKEITLPLHVLYVSILTAFTLLVCLGFFLFSFDTLLAYFNYPLVSQFNLSPFYNIFCGSTLSCVLPPLFLIGAVQRYGFWERFIRMLEVQSFFFLLLIIVFSFFMYYNSQLEDSMRAILNIHYFSAYTRLSMWLYMYFSIKVCIAAQEMPLPPKVIAYYNDLDAEYSEQAGQAGQAEQDSGTESDSQSQSEQVFTTQYLDGLWKKHEEQLPSFLRRALQLAQFVGFLLLILIFLSPQDFAVPNFLRDYSFFSIFFLYFYLLYKMRKSPYALWRPAYVALNLYIFVFYGMNEFDLWQLILCAFFLCQCFVVYALYWKSKNWFVS